MAYNSECVYRHNKKLLKFLKKCSALYVSSSVPFSRSVVSDSLQPHGSQHARLSRPSATPRASTQTHHVGYVSTTKYICESWAGTKIIAF